MEEFISDSKASIRKKMASEILRMIKDTEAFSNEVVRTTPMHISLKKSYYEYHYGIFAE